MTAFSGSALVLTWTSSAGTLQLETDYRTFTYTPSVEFDDVTAGADVYKEYLVSYRGGNAAVGGVLQAGSLPFLGSVLKDGLLGTMVWKPEGTAAGKYAGTAAFYSQGLVHNTTYSGHVEWTCALQQNGARTEGTL